MENIFDLMGINPTQRQRLATFSLKGDARKWYKTQFYEEERLITTWGEFLRRFDPHLISRQGPEGSRVTYFRVRRYDVSAYEDRFINLSHFAENMFQTKKRKARMCKSPRGGGE